MDTVTDTTESLSHAARKLRDSCRSCASSKVKCRKEKPACSRCVKRGITCEYLPTRRGGPKQPHAVSGKHVMDTGATAKSQSTPAPARVLESDDASSITVATTHNLLLQSPSLASWFSAPETNISGSGPGSCSGTATPYAFAIAEGDNLIYSDSTFGAGSDPFSRLFNPDCHRQSLRPPSMLNEMSSDSGQFLAASSALFPSLDLDSIGSDFMKLGQLDFFPAIADNWRVDIAGSPLQNIGDILEEASVFNSEMFEGQHTHTHTHTQTRVNPPPAATYPSLPEKANGSPHVPAQEWFSCSCMSQALGLIKKLFPPNIQRLQQQQQQQDGSARPASSPGMSIETVMTQNDATIEAAITMLQCECAEDDYLLVIISLMAFKVLGWYAAAARRLPANNQRSESPSSLSLSSLSAISTPTATTAASLSASSSSKFLPSPISRTPFSRNSEQVLRDVTVTIDSYRLEGEDSGRMASQLVLSKLHRAQRLVNQLSLKLKTQAARRKTAWSGGSDSLLGSLSSVSDGGDGGMPLPLSSLVLNQLEADLRRRLKTISSEILDELRRDQTG